MNRTVRSIGLVLAVFGFSLVALGRADAADAGKTLRTDVFGRVYVGDNPFAVGRVDTSTAGALRTDTFGNVYAGSSPFAVGKLSTSSAGTLHADSFGKVYAGSSPFSVGSVRKEDAEYLPFLQRE